MEADAREVVPRDRDLAEARIRDRDSAVGIVDVVGAVQGDPFAGVKIDVGADGAVLADGVDGAKWDLVGDTAVPDVRLAVQYVGGVDLVEIPGDVAGEFHPAASGQRAVEPALRGAGLRRCGVEVDPPDVPPLQIGAARARLVDDQSSHCTPQVGGFSLHADGLPGPRVDEGLGASDGDDAFDVSEPDSREPAETAIQLGGVEQVTPAAFVAVPAQESLVRGAIAGCDGAVETIRCGQGLDQLVAAGRFREGPIGDARRRPVSPGQRYRRDHRHHRRAGDQGDIPCVFVPLPRVLHVGSPYRTSNPRALILQGPSTRYYTVEGRIRVGLVPKTESGSLEDHEPGPWRSIHPGKETVTFVHVDVEQDIWWVRTSG